MRNPLSILAISILMTVFSGQSYGSLYGDPLGADKEFGTQDALDRVFEEYMQRKTPPTTRVDPVNTNRGGEEEVVVPTTRQQGGNQQLVEFFPNQGTQGGTLRIRIPVRKKTQQEEEVVEEEEKTPPSRKRDREVLEEEKREEEESSSSTSSQGEEEDEVDYSDFYLEDGTLKFKNSGSRLDSPGKFLAILNALEEGKSTPRATIQDSYSAYAKTAPNHFLERMEGFGWLTRDYGDQFITGATLTALGSIAREKLNQLLPDVREDAQAQEEESSSSSSSSSGSSEDEQEDESSQGLGGKTRIKVSGKEHEFGRADIYLTILKSLQGEDAQSRGDIRDVVSPLESNKSDNTTHYLRALKNRVWIQTNGKGSKTTYSLTREGKKALTAFEEAGVQVEERKQKKRRKVIEEEVEEEEEEVSDVEEDLDLAFDLDPENKEDRELIASMFKENGALKRGKKHVAINIKILKALNSADGTLPLTEIEFEATRRNGYMRTLQDWGWIDVASVIKNKNQYKIKGLGIKALKALIAYEADEITEDTLYPFFQKPQAKKKRKSRSLRNVDEEEYVDEEEGYEDEEEVIVPTSNSQQKPLKPKQKRRKKSKIPEEEENDDLGDKDMDIEVEEAGNPEEQGMEVEEEEDEIVQGGGLNPQQLFDGVHNEQVEGFILNTILRGEVLPQVQRDGDLLEQMRQAALGILTPKLHELMQAQGIEPGEGFQGYVNRESSILWKFGGE